MSKAIGMAEFKTVSAGITAADAMVKTADVEIIEAETVCPGKYIVILTGELSAVNASVETAKTAIPPKRSFPRSTALRTWKSSILSASSRRTTRLRSSSLRMKRLRLRTFL